jgi:hypothetical protein
MREEAESGGSLKRREVNDRVASAKDPPPYGAQHRQDALWKGDRSRCDIHWLLNKKAGGNEALPPQWRQFNLKAGDTHYQDGALSMVSWNRPLPGVRLGELRKCYHERGTYSKT